MAVLSIGSIIFLGVIIGIVALIVYLINNNNNNSDN